MNMNPLPQAATASPSGNNENSQSQCHDPPTHYQQFPSQNREYAASQRTSFDPPPVGPAAAGGDDNAAAEDRVSQQISYSPILRDGSPLIKDESIQRIGVNGYNLSAAPSNPQVSQFRMDGGDAPGALAAPGGYISHSQGTASSGAVGKHIQESASQLGNAQASPGVYAQRDIARDAQVQTSQPVFTQEELERGRERAQMQPSAQPSIIGDQQQITNPNSQQQMNNQEFEYKQHSIQSQQLMGLQQNPIMYLNQEKAGQGQMGALGIQENMTPQARAHQQAQIIPNVNMKQIGGDAAPHIGGQPIANMGAQDLSQMQQSSVAGREVRLINAQQRAQHTSSYYCSQPNQSNLPSDQQAPDGLQKQIANAALTPPITQSQLHQQYHLEMTQNEQNKEMGMEGRTQILSKDASPLASSQNQAHRTLSSQRQAPHGNRELPGQPQGAQEDAKGEGQKEQNTTLSEREENLQRFFKIQQFGKKADQQAIQANTQSPQGEALDNQGGRGLKQQLSSKLLDKQKNLLKLLSSSNSSENNLKAIENLDSELYIGSVEGEDEPKGRNKMNQRAAQQQKQQAHKIKNKQQPATKQNKEAVKARGNGLGGRQASHNRPPPLSSPPSLLPSKKAIPAKKKPAVEKSSPPRQSPPKQSPPPTRAAKPMEPPSSIVKQRQKSQGLLTTTWKGAGKKASYLSHQNKKSKNVAAAKGRTESNFLKDYQRKQIELADLYSKHVFIGPSPTQGNSDDKQEIKKPNEDLPQSQTTPEPLESPRLQQNQIIWEEPEDRENVLGDPGDPIITEADVMKFIGPQNYGEEGKYQKAYLNQHQLEVIHEDSMTYKNSQISLKDASRPSLLNLSPSLDQKGRKLAGSFHRLPNKQSAIISPSVSARSGDKRLKHYVSAQVIQEASRSLNYSGHAPEVADEAAAAAREIPLPADLSQIVFSVLQTDKVKSSNQDGYESRSDKALKELVQQILPEESKRESSMEEESRRESNVQEESQRHSSSFHCLQDQREESKSSYGQVKQILENMQIYSKNVRNIFNGSQNGSAGSPELMVTPLDGSIELQKKLRRFMPQMESQQSLKLRQTGELKGEVEQQREESKQEPAALVTDPDTPRESPDQIDRRADRDRTQFESGLRKIPTKDLRNIAEAFSEEAQRQIERGNAESPLKRTSDSISIYKLNNRGERVENADTGTADRIREIQVQAQVRQPTKQRDPHRSSGENKAHQIHLESEGERRNTIAYICQPSGTGRTTSTVEVGSFKTPVSRADPIMPQDRETKAALKIQTFYRMKRHTRSYKSLRDSTCKIQAIVQKLKEDRQVRERSIVLKRSIKLLTRVQEIFKRKIHIRQGQWLDAFMSQTDEDIKKLKNFRKDKGLKILEMKYDSQSLQRGQEAGRRTQRKSQDTLGSSDVTEVNEKYLHNLIGERHPNEKRFGHPSVGAETAKENITVIAKQHSHLPKKDAEIKDEAQKSQNTATEVDSAQANMNLNKQVDADSAFSSLKRGSIGTQKPGDKYNFLKTAQEQMAKGKEIPVPSRSASSRDQDDLSGPTPSRKGHRGRSGSKRINLRLKINDEDEVEVDEEVSNNEDEEQVLNIEVKLAPKRQGKQAKAQGHSSSYYSKNDMDKNFSTKVFTKDQLQRQIMKDGLKYPIPAHAYDMANQRDQQQKTTWGGKNREAMQQRGLQSDKSNLILSQLSLSQTTSSKNSNAQQITQNGFNVTQSGSWAERQYYERPDRGHITIKDGEEFLDSRGQGQPMKRNQQRHWNSKIPVLPQLNERGDHALQYNSEVPTSQTTKAAGNTFYAQAQYAGADNAQMLRLPHLADQYSLDLMNHTTSMAYKNQMNQAQTLTSYASPPYPHASGAFGFTGTARSFPHPIIASDTEKSQQESQQELSKQTVLQAANSLYPNPYQQTGPTIRQAAKQGQYNTQKHKGAGQQRLKGLIEEKEDNEASDDKSQGSFVARRHLKKLKKKKKLNRSKNKERYNDFYDPDSEPDDEQLFIPSRSPKKRRKAQNRNSKNFLSLQASSKRLPYPVPSGQVLNPSLVKRQNNYLQNVAQPQQKPVKANKYATLSPSPAGTASPLRAPPIAALNFIQNFAAGNNRQQPRKQDLHRQSGSTLESPRETRAPPLPQQQSKNQGSPTNQAMSLYKNLSEQLPQLTDKAGQLDARRRATQARVVHQLLTRMGDQDKQVKQKRLEQKAMRTIDVRRSRNYSQLSQGEERQLQDTHYGSQRNMATIPREQPILTKRFKGTKIASVMPVMLANSDLTLVHPQGFPNAQM